MSELDTNRFCWSWRSCFTTDRFNKKKTKRKANSQSNSKNRLPINECPFDKEHEAVDENSNLIKNFNSTCNQYNHQLIPDDYMMKTEIISDTIDANHVDETVENINRQLNNPMLTVRSTQLDSIAEDLNEENCDETMQATILYSDRELIDESNRIHTHLVNLCQMNHIINQLNTHGHVLGELIRHTEKFKFRINDVERTSTEMPRDAELLESRYSTLLATIESLSLLLKFVQVSSYDPLIHRLIYSIENRIEQLDKIVKVSSSINLRQQQQDFSDDDFLSFRSALSSYEHLLNIPS